MNLLESCIKLGKEISALKIAQARALGLSPSCPPELQAEALGIIAEAAGVAASPETGPFAPGEYVTAGYRRTYGGKEYTCLQSHVTQADWPPNAVPALWQKITPSGAPWAQPFGAEAYMTGDVVTHSGKTWISLYDYNVWEPGVYGWNEV